MSVLGKLSLLYAEDDIYIKNLLEAFFSNYFHQVYAVENGQEAINIYRSKKPDVVILDIEMPIMNGLEVARQIRKEDKETRIILITVHTEKNTLLQAMELGLTTFIEKPVNQVNLQQALQKLSSELSINNNVPLWDYQNKHYSWNTLERELYIDQNVVPLTKKEKLLLQAFIETRQKYLDYQKMYELVWIDEINDKYSESAIKTIIKKLRAKLPDGAIKNSYGMGYYLNRT